MTAGRAHRDRVGAILLHTQHVVTNRADRRLDFALRPELRTRILGIRESPREVPTESSTEREGKGNREV